jgi:hypothetical protein
MRTTGRMITIAESEFPAFDLPPRAARTTAGKLTTVPILTTPARPTPKGPSDACRLSEIERRKVNAPLTRPA